jgi:hypothetical protein
VLGQFQHAHVWQLLDHRGDAARPRWPRTMTVIALVGALVLSALIIVST